MLQSRFHLVRSGRLQIAIPAVLPLCCRSLFTDRNNLFSTKPITSTSSSSTAINMVAPCSVSSLRFIHNQNTNTENNHSTTTSSSSLSLGKKHQEDFVMTDNRLSILIYRKLFSEENRDTRLTSNKNSREHYATFLQTVEILCQESPRLSSDREGQPATSNDHHQRLTSLEFAKWLSIKSHSDDECTGSEFKDFYREDLPAKIRGGNNPKDSTFSFSWSLFFQDSAFRKFLSTTIFSIVTEARDSLADKPLRTIAEIASSSRFQDVRDRFAAIDKSLAQCVMAQGKIATRLALRNVAFSKLVAPVDMRIHRDRVTIICGASGTGKTVTSLAWANHRLHSHDDNVVIYMQLDGNFKITDNAERNEKVREWVNDTLYFIMGGDFAKRLKLDPRKDYHVVFVIDEVGRHPMFLAGLCSTLPTLVTELHNKFFVDQISSDDTTWATGCRVRFIAAGTGASFATAPAASNPDSYSTYFIGNRPTDSFYIEQVDAWQERLLQGQIIKQYNRESNNRNPTSAPLTRSDLNDIFSMLRRIDRAEQGRIVDDNITVFVDALHHRTKQHQTPWITATEKAAADLVRNARCAALLIRKAIAHSFRFDPRTDDEHTVCVKALSEPAAATNIPWWKSVAKFNERLRAWLPEVMNTYIAMNGLSLTADPVNIIKYAIATSLFRLPCLPDEFRSGLSPSSPVVPDYTESLITKGGVLVDLATASDAKNDTLIHLNDFVDSALTRKKNEGSVSDQKREMCVLTVNRTTARFFTSPAHVVMFRSACGLTFDRSPEFSYSLEYDLADFCAMTLICASAYLKMRRQIIELYPNGEGLTKLDEFDKMYNYKYDSLFGLKKKLAHEYCGIEGSIRGAKILHLVDSPLRSIQKYATMTRKSEESEEDLEKDNNLMRAQAKTDLLCADLEASLKRGEAVVIISKEMESFADVIIVSPGRVMLIQCKQKLQPREKYTSLYIDWIEEIEKMCGLDMTSSTVTNSSSDDKPKTEKELKHEMRSLYLDGLRNAAASAVSGNVEQVKVELVFVIEGEAAVCQKSEIDLMRKLGVNRKMGEESDKQLEKGLCGDTTNCFPVFFFGLHRRVRHDPNYYSFPPPFFPIPHHTEGLHVDNGCSFVTGGYSASLTSMDLVQFDEYPDESSTDESIR